MRIPGRLPRAARWLLTWAVFTGVMQIVTKLTGINHGWLNTAVLSAITLAFPRVAMGIRAWWAQRR